MDINDRIRNLKVGHTNLNKRLSILAKWLKEYSYSIDDRDGALETAMKRAKEETMHEIGDYIEEILAMDSEQIETELKQK